MLAAEQNGERENMVQNIIDPSFYGQLHSMCTPQALVDNTVSV